jgi:peptidoglycan/xylan/chitin deacetylase (PgdA/CDA1 family)
MLPVQWPDNARCAVMLSFDLDAETLMLYRDPANAAKPVLLSMARYGPKSAVPEIVGLLGRFGLKATFFIPGWVIEHYPEAVGLIVRGGHEVGAHGYLHERPDTLSRDDEDAILGRSVAIIRDATGRPPTGFRSPAWEFSPSTLELLEKHGFVYSSNMMDSIYPYYHRRPDGTPSLVELPVHWELDDAPFFLYLPGQPRPMAPIAAVFDTWRREFAAYYRRGGLFVLTLHPQLQRPARLDMLGRLIEYIREFPGVWFATGEEIAAYFRSAVKD